MTSQDASLCLKNTLGEFSGNYLIAWVNLFTKYFQSYLRKHFPAKGK
jgi:hypothetical protein